MSRKRVLVADDQRDVLTALELLFKSQGISATTVTSPDAIVAAVAREPFDAVLMDLNYTRDTTSGEEGLDVLHRLAAIPGAPPVIVMTAWGSIELAVEAMRRGARDFVTKPWDNRELVATVERSSRNGARAEARYSRNELEVAAQVQRKLWPSEALSLPGLELAGHCRPVGAVGGDTFDFIALGSRRVAFSLADVSGKGLPAALLMAGLQALLRSGVSQGVEDLEGVLEVANRHFFESTEPQHYATLFFAVYDEEAHELRYASCGHPAALILGEDGDVRRLTSTARAFGMFASLAAEVETARMRTNDTLVVFSDGLLEAEGPGGDELGEARLLPIVTEHLRSRSAPFAELPASLVAEILESRSYQQTDDVTVVAARRSG